jgi:putative addiction module component (TIGR02574 family)
MTDTVAELARRGRALPPEDRVRLVDLLLDSFEESADPAVAQAWRQEIRRRITAYERGEAELFDADEVMAEARRLAP